ncbi:hypothetical protein [Streptomyces sp. YGL11-2]|uniref:hypothetical protein n=1 Tax=Streptomyces sp. YGL11-2 TaxID=3414028 RepID=UPI003CEE8251
MPPAPAPPLGAHARIAHPSHPDVRRGARPHAGQFGQRVCGGLAVRSRVQPEGAVGERGTQCAHRLRHPRTGQIRGRGEEMGRPAVRLIGPLPQQPRTAVHPAQRRAVRPDQFRGALRRAGQHRPYGQLLRVDGARRTQPRALGDQRAEQRIRAQRGPPAPPLAEIGHGVRTRTRRGTRPGTDRTRNGRDE